MERLFPPEFLLSRKGLPRTLLPQAMQALREAGVVHASDLPYYHWVCLRVNPPGVQFKSDYHSPSTRKVIVAPRAVICFSEVSYRAGWSSRADAGAIWPAEPTHISEVLDAGSYEVRAFLCVCATQGRASCKVHGC